MMINRLELIEKIKQKIQEREQRAISNLERAHLKADEQLNSYVSDHQGDWNLFANRIRARLRKGQPVTMADVPQALRANRYGDNYVRVFEPVKVDPRDHTPRVEDFRSLLLVLESSPDELVSTSALERMGAPVKDLFR